MQLMAVEPRMLFDGAAAPTAEVVLVPKCVEAPAPAVNHDPVAVSDCRYVYQTAEIRDGQVVQGSPDGDCADSDPDGDPLAVVGVAAGAACGPVSGGVGCDIQGAYGVLHLGADGAYTYRPDPNAVIGASPVHDVFSYTISDGRGGQACTNLTFSVFANHAPIANDDARTILEHDRIDDGNAVLGDDSGDVADSDPDGGGVHVDGVVAGDTGAPGQSGVGQAIAGAFGTLTMQADGSYTYVPFADQGIAPGQTVRDVFTYTLGDCRGTPDTATVTITIRGNHDPVPNPDHRNIGVGERIDSGNVLLGDDLGDVADTDADGDFLTVYGVAAGTPPSAPLSGAGQAIEGRYGTLVVNDDGSYRYTPFADQGIAPGQVVDDVFTYTVCDGRGPIPTTTLTITIGSPLAGQHPPVANPDERSTTQGVAVDGNVILGGRPGEQADTDPDGDALRVQGVAAGTGPATGGVGNGIAGLYGTLTIGQDGHYTYVPGSAAAALGAGVTVDDVFRYAIGDGHGGTSSTSFTVHVTGLNDAPVANADARTVVDTGTITDGQSVTGNALGDRADTDADAGDVLSVIGVAAGNRPNGASGGVGAPVTGLFGTLTLNGDGSYGYVPNASGLALRTGESGQDVFTYTIRDTAGATSSATITVTVVGSDDAAPPVGDRLTARPDQKTTTEDAAVGGNAVVGGSPGDLADLDANGDAIQVQGVVAGLSGQTLTGQVGQAVAGQLGSLSLAADGSYTYTPGTAAQALRPGQTADDMFSYTVNDGHGLVSTSTITIHVTGLNDAPVAANDLRTLSDSGRIDDGQAIVGNALGDHADTDVDAGDTLTVIGVVTGSQGGGANGSVGVPLTGNLGVLTLNADGSYTYVPNAAGLALHGGETAQDVFTYTIRDAAGATSSATIAVNLIGSDALTARPDQKTTDEDTAVGGNAVVGGTTGDQADLDSSGDTIRVQGVAAGTPPQTLTGGVGQTVVGQLGSLVLGTDGAYTYTPGAGARALAPGQTADDVFSYTVNDGHGLVSTSTITIHVSGVNHPPAAKPDTVDVASNATGPATGNVVANDSDPDPGDGLTVVDVKPGSGAGVGSPVPAGQVVPGKYGQLVVNPDGSLQYTVNGGNSTVAGLAPGQSLTDTFTYTVRDPNGGTGSSTVAVNITAPGLPGAPPAPGTGQNGLPVAPLVIVPAGIVGLALPQNGAPPVPLLTDVTTRPGLENRFLLPPDGFNPFALEAVKGAVEESPKATTAMSEEAALDKAATRPLKRDDDCPPTVKTAVKLAPKTKPVAVKPSVFSKPQLAAPKTFSEQVRLATKRFQPPAKARVAPAVKPGC
jgi:VCBS repeat-containing protein